MSLNTDPSLLSEVADFIASRPTLAELAAYRMPAALDARIHDLLEKNREHELTPQERDEMQGILAVSHVMRLAKAKARAHA